MGLGKKVEGAAKKAMKNKGKSGGKGGPGAKGKKSGGGVEDKIRKAVK